MPSSTFYRKRKMGTHGWNIDFFCNRHKSSNNLNNDTSSKITTKHVNQSHNELKVEFEENKTENGALKRKLIVFEQRPDNLKAQLGIEKEAKEKALEELEKVKSTDKDNFKGMKKLICSIIN